MLSPYLFIDNLMKSLDKPYYAGLSSEAALYGAEHQQPMRDTVLRKALPAKRWQVKITNLVEMNYFYDLK